MTKAAKAIKRGSSTTFIAPVRKLPPARRTMELIKDRTAQMDSAVPEEVFAEV